MKRHEVLIVGGGVAGLSCAAELRRMGQTGIRVVERERWAGGVPRHCGHWGFGLREFGFAQTGPDYARRLVDRIGDVELSLSATVLGIAPEGIVTINAGAGPEQVKANAIVLAMGARESPRSARLISGSRPAQVMNTGTLQQLIYLHGEKPFERPVILGSELVSFSALLTLRHAGIRACAMIEENPRILARRPADLIARAFFGVPVLVKTRLVRILGEDRVRAIEIDRGQGIERIPCDGVIVSGKFRPETALLCDSHVALDPATLGPSIDQMYRCSDPLIHAAGNVLRPIETAGQCWREGRQAARSVMRALEVGVRAHDRIPVTCGGAIAYAYPQFLDRANHLADPLMFKARVKAPTKGWLRVLCDDREVWAKRQTALPERRLAWLAPERRVRNASAIEVRMDER